METFEHGGNIHKARRLLEKNREIIDFSANINPLGPPEWLRPVISSQLDQLIHYPDPENTLLREAAALHHRLHVDHILAGNGTTELLYAFLRCHPWRRLLVPVPCYVDYLRAGQLAGLSIDYHPLREEEDFALNIERLAAQINNGDLIIIGSPNNPTGSFVPHTQLQELAAAFPESFFLIDEAFLDFIEEPVSMGGVYENVATLNSMTKFYGLPGLRMGYGIFPRELAGRLHKILPPWTVNHLAQTVGARCLADHTYQQMSRMVCRQLRGDLVTELRGLPGLKLFPGNANYIFAKLTDGRSSTQLADHCQQNDILIRRCDNYPGLQDSGFIRVAVRTKEENQRLLTTFSSFFPGERKDRKGHSRKKPAIMFQGTCSNAGKSILTAALCRILRQDGVNVAPFKAQNMSLNSFVTMAGDEMGRAQVVQAQAARVDPDCRMNPILLKPNSDTGSQIIVRGKPVGNMSVNNYNSYKPKAWQAVRESYDSLADEYEVIVLEGAGSPGEVNLKADDIVNMRMAAYAEAPVFLVGDIDRGGVYSSFVGTMEVLNQWERQLIYGFIVNKFRGQADLLASAHEYVKLHTGRDVLGVVPYVANLGLPEEDSVSFKKGSFNRFRTNDSVDIAVLNLPHISNFTDLEPFLEEPDVTVRVIDNINDIGTPDAIILPGSKNVIFDLQFLKSSGFFTAIPRWHQQGTEIVGICGGYQMLGRIIHDPYQIESTAGSIDGLGLLPMETVIEKDKNLLRRQGVHSRSGFAVHGYEIHHGISSTSENFVFTYADGGGCGQSDATGRAWGGYLHGMFDSDEFRRWFIDKLREAKGLAPLAQIVAPYNLEKSFDALADCVRASIDIERIYQLLQI
jgi:adenosylcobyric acid synthase